MKATVFCLLAVAAVALARPSDKYTDKYDNINLREILDNDRLLDGYIKCILDKGRCSPEGKELKLHIKDALENDCAKCTETQRSGTDTTLRHLINKKPEYWSDLKAKFDPKDIYAKKYEARLKTFKA